MPRSRTALLAALGLAAGLLAGCDADPAPVAAPQGKAPAFLRYLGPYDLTAEAERIARTYRVVEVNPTPAGRALRDAVEAVDPSVVVLAYQDLSSTRSYDVDPVTGQDRPDLVTGVGWAEADGEHDAWFAVDEAGSRLEWDAGGYPAHWQMAVWDPGYQERWTASVVELAVTQGWDGIAADNANPDLAYNPGTVLGGGAGPDAPARGVRELVARAGAALTAQGKVLVPNVAEGRFRHGEGWWAGLAAHGGAMDERFLHQCDPPQSCFLTDDPGYDAGYDAQLRELGETDLPLVTTSGAWDDDRAFRYGYAGFLLGGGGTAGAFAYEVSPLVQDGRAVPPDLARLRPELTWPAGAPVGEQRRDGPVRSRELEGVFAAANPTREVPGSVELPPGTWVDAQGRRLTGRLDLAPLDAVVLRRA